MGLDITFIKAQNHLTPGGTNLGEDILETVCFPTIETMGPKELEFAQESQARRKRWEAGAS